MKLLLLGGIGHMEPLYRDCAKSLGCELLYKERGPVPDAHRPDRGQHAVNTLSGILVITSVVSHPILAAAERLAASCRIPIKYVRKPSISAVRRAIQEAVAEGQKEVAPS